MNSNFDQSYQFNHPPAEARSRLTGEAWTVPAEAGSRLTYEARSWTSVIPTCGPNAGPRSRPTSFGSRADLVKDRCDFLRRLQDMIESGPFRGLLERFARQYGLPDCQKLETLDCAKLLDKRERELKAALPGALSFYSNDDVRFEVWRAMNNLDFEWIEKMEDEDACVYCGEGCAVSFFMDAFIPSEYVDHPFTTDYFSGDNRSFTNSVEVARNSSRFWGEVVLPLCGGTREFPDKRDGLSYFSSAANDTVQFERVIGDYIWETDRGRADVSKRIWAVGQQGYCSSYFRMVAYVADPLIVGAPDVDMHFNASVYLRNGVAHIFWTAGHDAFPSFEYFVNGKRIHDFNGLAAGGSAWSLFGGEAGTASGGLKVPCHCEYC